jgi:hypothetical protein
MQRTELLILSLVLYGCATWPFTLRAEHRLGASKNRVQSGIVFRKGLYVAGDGDNSNVRAENVSGAIRTLVRKL